MISRQAFVLAPAAGGAAAILAFPPFNFAPAAWFAALPLLNAALTGRPGRSFLAGLFFGLPLNLYLNLYLAEVLFDYLSFALAAAALAALVIYISIFTGFFALFLSLIARLKCAPLSAAAIPVLFVMAEYLRTPGFLGYNVGYIGYSQWNSGFLLNLAASYGYWGLPFALLSFQALLIFAWRRQLKGPAMFVLAGALLLITLAGLISPELYRAVEADEPLEVILVQGNSSPEEVIALGSKEEIMARYLEMTQEAALIADRVDLVVWPETVVDLFLNGEPAYRQEMAEAAQNLNSSILYGARVRTPEHLYNSITMLDSEGQAAPFYHKQRLVPFVESFPFEAILNRVLDLELLLGSYSPGEELVLFSAGGATLGGVVCFESYFGDHARRFAAAGADHLFVLTNDSWFGETIGLDQHAHAAAIRAAEMGIGVTQVANSGITISFDYRGRELFRGGKSQEEVFYASLDLKKRATPYRLLGDYFPAALAIGLAAWVALVIVKKVSAKNL